MKCPHCDAEHPETAGRFCDNCGMSVQSLVSRDKPASEKDKPRTIRCRYCGVDSEPPRCLACGQKLSVPDDWED